jgi:hypothetical protein
VKWRIGALNSTDQKLGTEISLIERLSQSQLNFLYTNGRFERLSTLKKFLRPKQKDDIQSRYQQNLKRTMSKKAGQNGSPRQATDKCKAGFIHGSERSAEMMISTARTRTCLKRAVCASASLYPLIRIDWFT